MNLNTKEATPFFFARWQESLQTTFTARRARTMSTAALLDELRLLAASNALSGSRPSAMLDPVDGGHGTATMPDVVAELLAALEADIVLKRARPALVDALSRVVRQVKPTQETDKHRDRPEASSLAVELEHLASAVSSSWLEEALLLADQLLQAPDADAGELDWLAAALIGHLRAVGWSDTALGEMGAESSLPKLAARVRQGQFEYDCWLKPSSADLKDFLPPDWTWEAPPVSQGAEATDAAWVRVHLRAHDAHSAAAQAWRRVSAALGAASIFLPGRGLDTLDKGVVVRTGSAPATAPIEVSGALGEEKRGADRNDVRSIIARVWKRSEVRSADPLHDAVRLRHLAFRAEDPESRLVLLWGAIERLTSGALGHDGALGAAKAAAAPAVVFSKMRRDVGDIGAWLQRSLKDTPAWADISPLVVTGEAVDRQKVMAVVRDGASAKTLSTVVRKLNPLLAWRIEDLAACFSGADDKANCKNVMQRLEQSESRVSWHLSRIYRARNHVAHAGREVARSGELVWHANYYLTQLIAICVDDAQRADRTPREILASRAGMYRAYRELLSAGEQRCLSPSNLLDPKLLLGQEKRQKLPRAPAGGGALPG